MAVEQITTNSPDGATMGQSATEKNSFYGAVPIVRATATAAGTDAATTQTLANGIRSWLITIGLWT